MAVSSIILPLSGSSGASGKPIPITSTAIGSAQVLHTASSNQWDQPILQVTNVSTAAVTLVLGFGSSAAQDLMHYAVQPQDGYAVVLNGDAVLSSGREVQAYTTGSTAALNVIGKVIRSSTG